VGPDNDGGLLLSRAIRGGVGGGLAAGLVGTLVAASRGLPWWSALALYTTTFGGLSPAPVVAQGLAQAVLAGLVWLAGLGMALGALFGLVAGTVGPHRLRPASAGLLGAALALSLFGAASSAGIPLLSPAFRVAVPPLGRAAALTAMGATLGAWAAARGRPDLPA
jgi:hypothetical protein